MDSINITQMAAQGALTLSLVGAYKLFNWGKKRSKIVGVALPVGKTHICQCMSDRDNLFIDVDEYLSSNHNEKYELYKDDEIAFLLHLFPEVEKYLALLFKSFSNKRLFVVSSHYELLCQLNIRKIYSYIPSKELLHSIQQSDHKLELKSYILAERSRKKYVFNTWAELKDKIRKKFHLKQILN